MLKLQRQFSIIRKIDKNYYKNIDLSCTGTCFKFTDLQVTKNPNPQEKLKDISKLEFGAEHTDHMLICDWNATSGWEKPQIVPFENFSIHPFNSSFHYAVQCFEGMKAFLNEKNQIITLNPDLNMHRLKNSMVATSLPDFDGAEFLKCQEELIRIDKDFIPKADGYSLYIRPTGISMQNKLGVVKPTAARLYTVLSPVGPYFSTGFKPVTLLLDEGQRSVRGIATSKIGANYGPTIIKSANSVQQGYDQCLYQNQGLIGECGAANIFFLWRNSNNERELVTPDLSCGDILPGTTRNMILELTREWPDIKVSERDVTVEELIQNLKQNRIEEAFLAGTAVIACPIKGIGYQGINYDVPIDPEINGGKTTHKILKTVQDIQYGRVQHKYQKFLD